MLYSLSKKIGVGTDINADGSQKTFPPIGTGTEPLHFMSFPLNPFSGTIRIDRISKEKEREQLKRTWIRLIGTLCIAGLVMVLPHTPCCQQPDQRITIFYTNDLQGVLTPCE